MVGKYFRTKWNVLPVIKRLFPVLAAIAILLLFQTPRNMILSLPLLHHFQTQVDNTHSQAARQYSFQEPVLPLMSPHPGPDFSIFIKLSRASYTEYYQKVDSLRANIQHNRNKSMAAAELETLEKVRPLPPEARARLLFCMDAFVRACQANNLTFHLSAGGLLGAYRHHGAIPWDVEVDVVLNGSHYEKAQKVLSNITGFRLSIKNEHHWGFYVSSPHAFPYLDIFFFDDNINHARKGHSFFVMQDIPYHYIFPLKTARWELWDLHVPACPKGVLNSRKYKTDDCTSYYTSNNKGFSLKKKIDTVPCSELHQLYPFVFRHTDPVTGQFTESKRVGERVIHDVRVPPLPADCPQ